MSMDNWVILHHHRHGVDIHLVRSKDEPTSEQIEKGLTAHGNWEPDPDERIEGVERYEWEPRTAVDLAAWMGGEG